MGFSGWIGWERRARWVPLLFTVNLWQNAKPTWGLWYLCCSDIWIDLSPLHIYGLLRVDWLGEEGKVGPPLPPKTPFYDCLSARLPTRWYRAEGSIYLTQLFKA